MNRGRSLVALLMMGLMLTAIPSTSANQVVAVDDETIDYTNQRIVVELDEDDGRLDLVLGDARMRLEWGVSGDEGEISLFTSQTHYMGVADAYEEDGSFSKRVGIPINTVFYQKLDGILEYEDVNDDGLFNVRGQGFAGTLNEVKGKSLQTEPVQQYILFKDIAWTMASLVQDCDANNCSIDFTLEANNLSYSGDHANSSTSLETLRYIFHVDTTETSLDVEAVPHYKVVHHKQEDGKVKIDSSERLGEKNVTADVLNSIWKYDQVLRGWDATGNDTRLMTIVEYGMGAYMTNTVADWAKKEFDDLPGPTPYVGKSTKKAYRNGQVDLDTHDPLGTPLKCDLDYIEKPEKEEKKDSKEKKEKKKYVQTHCTPEGDELKPDSIENASMIRAGGLHFDNNGANMASIRWVSNATVDESEHEVLFQLHGIRPLVRSDLTNSNLSDSNKYKGVRMIGGYNHPVGENILHDPEYDIDVMTLDTEDFGEIIDSSRGNLVRNLLRLAPVVAGIIVVGVVGAVIHTRRRSRKAATIPKAADYPAIGQISNRGRDWEAYNPDGER